MREPEPSCEPGRDRHRPVDSRCHDPIRKLGAGEAVESFLVLGRDDGAAIGVGEAGRRGVAIARDHEEPALAGGGEQPELGGPGAEDKKTGRHGEANVAGAASVAPATTGPTAATIRHIRAAGPTLATGPPASLAPDGMSPKDTAEGGRRREAGPGPRKPTRVELAAELDALRERVAALEKESPRLPARPLATEDLLPSLRELAMDGGGSSAAAGTVMYAGVGPRDDGEVAWQIARRWEDVLAVDRTRSSRALGALGSPARLDIVGELLTGPLSRRDLRGSSAGRPPASSTTTCGSCSRRGSWSNPAGASTRFRINTSSRS